MRRMGTSRCPLGPVCHHIGAGVPVPKRLVTWMLVRVVICVMPGVCWEEEEEEKEEDAGGIRQGEGVLLRVL